MSSEWDFNLYDELGIPKTATQDEIKKAYKKMAMKWHPDKNTDNSEATERFQRISHAYSILSDPKKRDYYDRFGKVDEDNFNFEEFMKDFNFNFGEMFMDPFFMSAAMMESRHGVKLMCIRKEAENKPIEISENFDKVKENGFSTFIYGKGKGLENRDHLMFWKEKETKDDDEWEEFDLDEENLDEENDVEDCEEQGLLDFFIMSNTQEKGKNIICEICKEQNKENPQASQFTSKTIHQHFLDNHKTHFEEFYGTEASWEDVLNEEKKKKDGKKKGKGGKGKKGKGGMPNMFDGMPNMFGGGMPNMFGGGGGMPFMFDMNMMNMSPEEEEKMFKEFEKMMGGMGMGGGMFDMFAGMPGMGNMGGGNKKKKKK